MEEAEENGLDQRLRGKFEDFDLVPSPHVWAGVQQRLSPAPAPRGPRWPLPLPLLFGLVALLAGLTGWLLPHEGGRPAAQRAPADQTVAAPNYLAPAPAVPGAAVAGATGTGPRDSPGNSGPLGPWSLRRTTPGPTTRVAGPVVVRVTGRPKSAFFPRATGPLLGAPGPPLGNPLPLPQAGAPGAASSAGGALGAPPATAAGGPAATVPPALRALVVLEAQVLPQLPAASAAVPAGPPAAGRRALLGGLRAERAELRRLQRRADSLLLALGDSSGGPAALPRPLAHRWSLLLTATPEQNTLSLDGPAGDSLTAPRRYHEVGRAGLSVALAAEYQLTPRLSVGGGVGYTAYGVDLRLTTTATAVRVAYDSTTTTTVRPDSTRFVRKTITPRVSTQVTAADVLLQPQYRFLTVPLRVRYRLAPGPGRWWADVSGGAQLQFFLGGTGVVTADGETFRTVPVGPGTGPFRALNVALSGALALNYALTDRLSLSVAPGLRWQVLSTYKPETGLRQRPTATGLQVGVRFRL